MKTTRASVGGSLFARGWKVADANPLGLRRRAGLAPGAAERRAVLEALEPRQMLAVAVWTGAFDGQTWDNAGNWLVDGSEVRKPTDGDDVFIDEGGSYAGDAVVFDVAGSVQVASITASANGLNFVGGTLNVSGAMTMSRVSALWTLTMGAGSTVHAGSITATNVILGSSAGSNLLSAGAISISGQNVHTVFGTVHGLGGVNLGGPNSALGMGATGVINGGSGDVVIGANGEGYADVGGTLIGNVITINTGETALGSAVVNAASNLVFNVPTTITGSPTSINTPLVTVAGTNGVGAAGLLVIGGSNNQIGGVTGAVGAISLSTNTTLGVSNLTLSDSASFTSSNGAGINLLNVTGFTSLTIASEGAVQIAGAVGGDSLSVVAPAVDVLGTSISLTNHLYVETTDGFLLGSLVSAPLLEFVGTVESNSSTLTAATKLRLVGIFQQVGGSIFTPRVELMGGVGMVYHLSSPSNEIAVFAGDLHANHHHIDSGSVATIGDLVIEGFAGGSLDIRAQSVAQSDRLSVATLTVHADDTVLLDHVENDISAVSVLPRVGTLASVVLANRLGGGTSLVVDQDNHGIRAGYVRLVTTGDVGTGFFSPAGSNFGAIVADTLFLEGRGYFHLESDANDVAELGAAVEGAVVYRSSVAGVDLVAGNGSPVFSSFDTLTVSVPGHDIATTTDVVVNVRTVLSARSITQGGALIATSTVIATAADTTLNVQTDSFNGFVDGNLNLTLTPKAVFVSGVALDSFGGGGFGLLTFGDAAITVAGDASLFINAGINTHGGDLSINSRDVGFLASPFNFLLSANLDLNLSGVGLPSFLQGGDINVASLSGFVDGTLVLQDVDGLTLGRAGSGFTAQTLELSTLAVNQPADVFQSGPLTVNALVLSVEGGVELTDAGNVVGSIAGSVFDVFRYGSDAAGALTLDMGTASTIGVGVNLTNPLSALNVVHAQGSAGVDLRAGSISGGDISGDQAALVAYANNIDVSNVRVNRLAAQAPGNITIATTGNTLIESVSLFFGPGAVDGIVAGGDVNLTFDHSSDILNRIIAQNLTITLLAGHLTTLPVAIVSVPGLVQLHAPSGGGLTFAFGSINFGAMTADAPGSQIVLVDVDGVDVQFVAARLLSVVAAGSVSVGNVFASESVQVEAGEGPTGGTLVIAGTISAPTVFLTVAAGAGALTLYPSSVSSNVLVVDAADLTLLNSCAFGEITATGNVHLFEHSRITIGSHAYFDAPGSVLTVEGNAGLYAGEANSDSSININRIESVMSIDGGTLDLFTRGILRITGGTPGNPSMLNGDLNIRANNLQLDGYLTSATGRNLFLGTYSDGIDIKIGDDSFGPPFLGVTAAEIANIGPGFANVLVGGTNEGGSFGPRINFYGDTTWNASTVFTASGPTDILSYGATVRSANGAALTFNTTDGARFVVNNDTASIIATGNVSINAPVVLAGGLSVNTAGATLPATVLLTGNIDGFHGFAATPTLSVLVNPDSTVRFLGSIGVGESVDAVSVSRPAMAEGRPAVEFGQAGEPFVSRVVNTGAAGIVGLDANVMVHSELFVATGTLTIAGALAGGDPAAAFFANVSGPGSSITGNVSSLATIQLTNNGTGDFSLPGVLNTGLNVLAGDFSAGAGGLHLIGGSNAVGGSISTPGPITIDGFTFIGIGGQTLATTLAPGGDLAFNSDISLLVDLDIDMTGAPANALVEFAGTVDSYGPGAERSLGIVLGNEARVVFERSVGSTTALSAIHIAPVPPPDLDNLPYVDFGAIGGPADPVVVRAESVFLGARVSVIRDTDLQVGHLTVLGSLSGVEAPTLNVRVTDQGSIGGAVDGFLSVHLDGDTPGGPGHALLLGGQLLSGLFVSLDGFVDAQAAELQVFGEVQLSAALHSAGPVFFAGPVVIGGPAQSLEANGNVVFSGPVSLQADATVCAGPGFSVSFLGTIAVNGFTLLVCGDEINFSAAVSGPGFLNLQQVSNFLPINLAYDPGARGGVLFSETDPNPGTLDITETEYGYFGDDLDGVSLGEPTFSTTVDIGGVTLTSNTEIYATGTTGGGGVRVRNTIKGTGGSGIGINGSFTTTQLFASISLTGGTIRINDSIVIVAPGVALATDDGAPAGAPVTVAGAINSAPGEAQALAIFGGAAAVELQGPVGSTPAGIIGTLTVAGGTATLAGGQVNTLGEQTYNAPVQVQGSVSVSTQGAQVSFNNTVAGGAGAELVVVPGTGQVNFAQTVMLATVEINTGNNRTFTAPVEIGLLRVLGGEVVFEAPATVLGGTFAGGSITGSGEIILTGLFTWTGGVFNGSGPLTVAPTGTLAVAAGGEKVLARSVGNDGLISWQGGDVVFDGGAIANRAELFASADGVAFSGTGTIDNTGLLRRGGNDGVSTIAVALVNGSGGVIVVEQGTLLILPPAPPRWSPLRGARGGLDDQPAALLRNGGTLTLMPGGTLRIGGAFAQGSGGTIAAVVNGPAGFGTLVVDGVATLDGSFQLRFADGYDGTFLDPSAASRWTFLRAGQTQGAFAQVALPGLPPRRVIHTTFANGVFELLYTHVCDINRDGLLNPDDLGDFITEYFNPGNVVFDGFDVPRDFNGDGMIDSDDLGDFIMNYYADFLEPQPG